MAPRRAILGRRARARSSRTLPGSRGHQPATPRSSRSGWGLALSSIRRTLGHRYGPQRRGVEGAARLRPRELPAKGAVLTDTSYVRVCLADGREAKGPNAPLVQALQTLLRVRPIHGTSLESPATPGCLGTRALTAPPLGALGRAAQSASSRA